MRNLLSFSIATLYCFLTVKDPIVAAYRGKAPEFPTRLYDFELAILNSVLPYLYFKRFVNEDKHRKAAFGPHLKIVTAY